MIDAWFTGLLTLSVSERAVAVLARAGDTVDRELGTVFVTSASGPGCFDFASEALVDVDELVIEAGNLTLAARSVATADLAFSESVFGRTVDAMNNAGSLRGV